MTDCPTPLSTYGHVIDELEDVPRIDAEGAIAEARVMVGSTEQRPTRESKA